MRNLTGHIVLFFFASIFCINLDAQQKHPAKPQPKTNARKPFLPPVYIGNSDYRGGPITSDRFRELMMQGLKCHDSLGNKYKITGFDFSFAEHRIYEDSVGNLIKAIDFTSIYMKGDMLTPDLTTDADTTQEGDLSFSIFQRAKPGDTIFFDHIMVRKQGKNTLLSIPDTIDIAGKPIKCVIAKQL